MNYTLKELLDIPKLTNLLNILDDVHNFPCAVDDTEGNILVATAWQDICTKFHRVNPESEKKCIESDQANETRVQDSKTPIIYTCALGLVDTALPIIIEGRRIGYVYVGQFFLEPPDEEYFIRQAHQYGFDENKYLDALRKVPVFTEEQFRKNLSFIHGLTQILAEQGLQLKRQKKVEEQLQELTYELNIILENAPIGISKTIDRRQILVNQKTLELLQYSKEEMENQSTRLLYPSDDAFEKHGLEAYPLLAKGQTYETVQSLVRKDGTLVDIRYVGKAIDPADMSKGALWLLEDITEKKKSENELRISNTRFKSIIEASPVPYALNNESMNITFLNPAFIKTFGYTLEDIPTLKDWWEKAYPDQNYRKQVLSSWSERFDKARIHATQFEPLDVIIRCKDGTDRTVIASAAPLEDSYTGEYLVILFDITERTRFEKYLLEAKSFQDSIIDQSPINMWVSDNKGTLVRANEALLKQLNVTLEEVVGIYNIFDDPILNEQGLLPLIHDVFDNGRTTHFTVTYDTSKINYLNLKRTSLSILEVTISPVFNSEGKLTNCIIQHLDITERKKAEDALQQLIYEQAIILDNAGVGISFVKNRHQKWANNTFAKIVGYNPDEIAGSSTSRYFQSQDEYNRFTEEAHSVLASGDTFTKSLLMPRYDGSLFHARFTGKAINPDNLSDGCIWILSDETIEKELEFKLQQSHSLLTTLSHQIPGTIYQFQLFPDGRSCFPYASDAIIEMYEVTPEEVREDATPVFAILHPEDLDGVSESIMESARTLQPWEYDYRVKLPQKGIRWRHGFSRPQKMPDGSILWHGFITDITDQKIMENELIDARNTAETASRAKSEFLANMSHEIRTPMNGVIGMAQLLELTHLTEEQKEYVTTLRTSGKNLLSLINDILDLSKIEAGKIVVEPVEFNLNQCINDVILMQKSTIYEKGLLLEVDVAENIPACLLGDQLRIKQIILNLLGNAAKFTSKGKITISATLFEQGGDTVHVQIVVCDTGIGISPDALDRIFKPFVQEDGSTTRKYGGTGLGLSISLRLVELLGGSFSVESTQGVGSCFTITLPFSSVHNGEQTVTTGINSLINSSGPRLRILYVEDDQTNLFFGKSILNKLGHDVTLAENGRECLETLEKSAFDIVLMDIQMPVMNGEEAINEIRKKEQGTASHQLVIALTAFSMRGDKEHYLEDGFDGYVTKPLSISELVQEMNRLTDTVEISVENHD